MIDETKNKLREYRKRYYAEHKDKLKEQMHEYKFRIKRKVIEHYGGKCVICGETRLAFLVLDHIGNNGTEHREVAGNGTHFYLWIINNDYPGDLQVMCWNHNQLKQMEIYNNKPIGKRTISDRKRNRKLKQDVINYYGGKCVCCGQDNIDVLSIDHIEGGGSNHRKEIGQGRINKWLRDNNYPEGFQVTCFNCNCGREVNGGICPHNEYGETDEY